MYQLIQFFLRLRIFFTFVILEIIAAWLIVRNNTYQGVAFFTSSNVVAGVLYTYVDGISGQLTLRDEVERLQKENASLNQQLNNLKFRKLDSISADSTTLPKTYKYLPARVINNTVRFTDNYLTINKGKIDGIEVGMGVVSPEGVVGRVRSVSNNFATVYSLLHSNIRISGQLSDSKDLCTVKWNTEDTNNDYRQAELQYIPFHVDVQEGDTIETSGANPVYPEGIDVGIVESVKNDLSEGTKNVKINLTVNFSNIKNVYIIQNYYQTEIDSLEQNLDPLRSK
ncbi:MAG: rod shape-determining protein MreC [Thalassobius sp.]|nr:rod shape-determining protein MreC [Thalassovita sp.]